MLEVSALALTFGAVVYEQIHAELFVLILTVVSVAVFCWFSVRTLRGLLFGLVLGGAMLLGALALWNEEREVSTEIFGNRAFDANVVSVDRRLGRTNLTIRGEDHREKLQIFVYQTIAVLPGDTISVRGVIERPDAFLTDTGRLFDYPAYLAGKGIVGVGRNAQVILQDEGGFSLSRIATIIRFRIADMFARHLSFPIDGVIAGMTVGYQGALPDSIQDLFRNTGVLHVLVLSGYNITLLAGFLGLLLRHLPFRLRTVLIIVSIALLVMISGSGIASVRAGIMGGIAMLAGLSIRTYRPLRALTLAYLFFFFLSPRTIFSDPGFHLSFLATAFMVFGLSKVERFFSFIPKTRGVDVRELLMLAVSLPIFMLPYTMYFSGAFPISSPIANILLALATPLLMVLGIAVLVFSWASPISHILGLLASFLGQAVLWILEGFARLPIWQTPAVPWWAVAGVYSVFFVVLFRREFRSFIRQLQNSLAPASSSFDP